GEPVAAHRARGRDRLERHHHGLPAASPAELAARLRGHRRVRRARVRGRLVTASPRRASLALLFVVVATHWLIRRALCGRATRADTRLAAADREARDQYVVLSENIERREQDRLMHDTILNTLTAIARSGGTPAAISQCRQDR